MECRSVYGSVGCGSGSGMYVGMWDVVVVAVCIWECEM